MEKILLKRKKELVIILISYLKEYMLQIIIYILVIVFINVYFIYLCGRNLYMDDLLYLDIILVFLGFVLLVISYLRYQQVERIYQRNSFLTSNKLKEYLPKQTIKIIEKNNFYYSNENNYLRGQIQELSDYITKWSHETKLPIASLRLMNERNNDLILKKEMRLVIEQIQLLVNTMLMSSKLRNPENDIKIEKILISQVIKEVIKHHSYFLINDHFTINLKVENEYVYSDRRWLTYMLDQFITNSIKYKSNNPKLTFVVKQNEKKLTLIIEDNGIGISKEDVPYIFDRGFIGHNLRDGNYRSTGMGLYFVKEIAKKLEIRVLIDKNFNSGSRFILEFVDNAKYFLLDY